MKKVENWSDSHLLLKLSNLHSCRSVQLEIENKEFRLILWEINDQSRCISISYNGDWIGDIDKRTGEIEARFGSFLNQRRIDWIANVLNKWDSQECEQYRKAIQQMYVNQLQRAQIEFDRMEFRLSDQSRLCL